MNRVEFIPYSFEDFQRVGRNGAIRAGYQPYSHAEDSFLMENYQQIPIAEVSGALGRSRGSIIARVKKLARDGFMSYKPTYLKTRYTAQEDKFIIANQASMSFREVATALGRNLGSVKYRASRLGVSYAKISDSHHRTKYTADDVELMRQLRDYGLSFVEIGDKFGVAASQARRICNFELRLYQDRSDFLLSLQCQLSAIDSNN
ncbi:DNA-binding protein [Vibrio tapetis]|uniref:Uncharacterized protein n=1 Tax=Vibrio tapetis subsp. tapetis TaxID=1671868 RepID=A0A2N8ZLD9_9VIBR|nr:DNA-binding protein [Vibrio tapetis]SON52707.1 conserved protein of unknown function [Vibrio tapetis subsp. tapetis]